MTTAEHAVARPTPRRWWSAMWATVVSALVGVVLLLVVAATRADVMIWVVGVLTLLMAGLCWLVLAPIGCARYRRYRLVSAAPVIVLAGAGLLVAQVPEKLAWGLSEGALTEAAHSCQESEAGWFGVLRIDRVRAADGGCQFSVAGISIGGLAYFPPQTSPPDHGGRPYTAVYTHYDGDWYEFDVIMHD
ncbi:hypothetical protein ACFO5K_01400 [Nocardia halotolerans]|uniref:DUF4190 domain-containing protein n=1 Tax=Nocardia halotolerans TaxID=1755878 RepID=A0ABV8VDE5_9NOCA